MRLLNGTRRKVHTEREGEREREKERETDRQTDKRHTDTDKE